MEGELNLIDEVDVVIGESLVVSPLSGKGIYNRSEGVEADAVGLIAPIDNHIKVARIERLDGTNNYV